MQEEKKEPACKFVSVNLYVKLTIILKYEDGQSHMNYISWYQMWRLMRDAACIKDAV